MTVINIDAPGGKVRFARRFIKQRLKGFKKDLAVCLKVDKDKDEERAFMPMLTNVIALLELFSGLYSGKLTYRNATHLFAYLDKFAPGRYDDYSIQLLYIVFRHKLAHASHPYVGFDTSKVNELKSRPMRLAWSITAFPRPEAIKISK